MKKIVLGIFLIASALSFAAGRKISGDQLMTDQNTGIAYVKGE